MRRMSRPTPTPRRTPIASRSGPKAAERLTWSEPWTQVLDWSGAPFARWFVGGKLNVAYNCVDRHVESGHGAQVAYHWEGEPGDTRSITYAELLEEVCRAANALIELGVKTGDRVAIYLPMIPEAVVAMLACARLGAPHTVVFGGFSAAALSSRILDCGAQCRHHRGRWVPPRRGLGPQAGRRRGAGILSRTSGRCWWCVGPDRTWPGRKAATSGGTTW